MSTKLFVPLEQAKLGINLSLNETIRDNDVIQSLLAAQKIAEKYCRRGFDGEKEVVEYISGNNEQDLILKNWPIRSVTSIYIDPSHAFGADTLVDSSDYSIIDAENGLVTKSSETSLSIGSGSVWKAGNKNIKVSYLGGWIAEKTVVASASPNAAHTIADDISSYGQPFSIMVHTSGTSGAGNVVITGLDENGDSFSETITPLAASLTAGKATTTFSKSKWTDITVVNSSGVTGGAVRVTGVSMPDDLRYAIQVMTAHLYKMDQQNQVNVLNRSTQGESETLSGEIPQTALSILNLYKDIEF